MVNNAKNATSAEKKKQRLATQVRSIKRRRFLGYEKRKQWTQSTIGAFVVKHPFSFFPSEASDCGGKSRKKGKEKLL